MWLDLHEDIAELFSDARFDMQDHESFMFVRRSAENVEHVRQWRTCNRERHNKTVRARYRLIQQQERERGSLYREKNAEQIRVRQRARWAANKDALNERRRARRAAKRKAA